MRREEEEERFGSAMYQILMAFSAGKKAEKKGGDSTNRGISPKERRARKTLVLSRKQSLRERGSCC